MSFFAAFFVNGMALTNRGWTLQESKEDFFNSTSCRWNEERKLYSGELLKKSNIRKGNFSTQNVCTMSWPEGSSALTVTQQAIYTLYKYSLDVWFDLFYLFCGYQQSYDGDISLLVKCPLFSNITQLAGPRSEVNLREVRGMGSRLCRSPWRSKLVCYSEHNGRSLFQQSLIYVCFCLFFYRVNLHSFDALVCVRGVICWYIIYFCPNPCFIFVRVWNSLSKCSTQKLLQIL